MSNKKIKVGINGYGIIGKRVADAVRLQPDMELVGVSDVVSDYRIKAGIVLGLPIFASLDNKKDEMESSGIPVAGTLDDLLKQIDIIVDCTPKGIGANNLELYRKAGVKSIYQGGEEHSLTGHSFVAQANYETAIGLNTTRVVSCNTTSTVRTLTAIRNSGLLKKARGVLIRRATDPWESDHSGIMNTVVPEPHIPSHQGPDAQTVVPELDVITLAAKASHTQTHNHYWVVELTRKASREEVLAAFIAAPRISFIRIGDGIVALNSTIELMKDLGRPRGDMWEVALWEDVLTVDGNEVYYTYQVYNEAIVVPENIDAIRALTGTIKSGKDSIRITDEAMGIRKEFLVK
ncbi:glyceraldehyde-3-phosphate dehydrogenase [bacterium BMS3Abin04]|nr:glyceraldehyde-3-phosphate dehydrogenase [bacterium BMS3Abin04]